VARYYSDTHPEMEALQIELMRSSPAWRKIEMLTALNRSARSLALAGLQQRHPLANEAELERRLADLLLGPDLAHKIFAEKEDAA